MTDIPPDSPIDIRALALYDIHQWKTTEKSHKNYEKLCELLGNEAISFEEYEIWFNKFLEESYHSTRDGSSRGFPIPDIRGCILSDVINGKSAEKSIDDLCDAFKDNKINKEDYDYWYKRFDSGHLFNRVTFSDFPEDVISEIVEKCDIISYLNLRNVSFGLRTVIDQLAPPCTDIEVECGEYGINVCVDNEFIANSEHFDILELLLRNPKLRLEHFHLMTHSHYKVTYFMTGIPPRDYKQQFFDSLNSLDHKIHVERCVMNVEYENDVIEVLKCLKPGTLEYLEIDMGHPKSRINKVVRMDQWKAAKRLKIHADKLPPINYFFHFSTFELRYPAISMTDLFKLCENASNFESFTLKTSIYMEKEEIKRVLNLQPTASPQIYSIPNKNLFIHFLIDGFGMESYKIYKD